MAEEFVDIRIRLRDYQAAIAGMERTAGAAKMMGAETATAGARAAGASRGGFNMFTRGAEGMRRGALGLLQPVRSMAAGWFSAAKGLAAMAGAFATYEGIKSAVKSTVDLGTATLRLHRSTGLSTDSSTQWAAMAKVRGVDLKQLTMGFTALSRNIGGAETGTKSSIETFNKLGITTQELKKHHGDFNWVLGQTIQGFHDMKGGSDRLAASQKLFGRGAQGLSGILAMGKKGMEDEMSTIRRMGVHFSGGAKGVQEFLKAQHDSQYAMLGFQLVIGQKILPILTKLLSAFASAWEQGQKGKGIFGTLRDIFHGIGPIIHFVAEGFGKLPGPIKALAGIAIPAIFVMLLGGGPIGAGIAALVAGAALIVTHWKQVAPFFKKIAGEIGHALGINKKDFKGILDAAKNVFEGVKKVVGFLAPFFKIAFGAIIGIVKSWVKIIGGMIKVITGLFTGDFGKMWKGVKQIFSGAIHWLTSLVGAGFQVIGHVISIAAHAIWSVIKGALDLVTGIWKSAFEFWKGVASGALDAIGGFFNSTFGRIPGFIKGIFDTVIGFFKGLPGAVASVFTTIWGGITAPFKAAINAVIDIWNSMPHLSIGGGSVLGVSIPKVDIGLPHVPHVFAGGTVTQAGSALVGDMGPELISLPAGATVSPIDNHKRPVDRIADALHRSIRVEAPVIIDGREVARAVSQHTSDRLARR